MKLRHTHTPRRAVLLCAAALQSLAMPVMAQSTDNSFTAALRGQGTPLSIKARELTSEWRRFTANPQMLDLRTLAMEAKSTGFSPFYTHGDVVKVGSENFLVAYRMPKAAANSGPDSDEALATDENVRLREGDVLTLSLLNVRTMGDLNDVRAFEPSRDIMSDAEQKRLEIAQSATQSERNLKMIGLGLLQYTQDYDELFPPMRSVQSKAEITQPTEGKLVAVQQAIQPYVKSVEIFSHPVTQELYRPNIAVSGVNMSSIDEPSKVVAFWEKSAVDGTRAVLYLDGHVKREREADWPGIMAQSNKILPPRVWKSAAQLREEQAAAKAAAAGRNGMRTSDAAARLPDWTTVTPAVKTALGSNVSLKKTYIVVNSTANVVTLEGVVHTPAQKSLAEAIARKHAPSHRIVNNLRVR